MWYYDLMVGLAEKLSREVGVYFAPDERVVVGVSGGPDSVALVHLLSESELRLTLFVCHLNHCIRGREAEEDARFVEELARRLRLEFFVEEADVPAIARDNRLSLETAARKARYEFLGRCARKLDAKKVAVAHNLDDQAETVLMRILRGTGLRGLRGMLPVRKLAEGLLLVRPLLTVTRNEILEYLVEKGLEYREDRTNTETKYLRNRLRWELIPLLEEISPGVRERLVELARRTASLYEFIERQVRSLSSSSDETLETPVLRGLPEAIAGEAVRVFVHDRFGVELYSTHTEALLKALQKGSGIVSLPGGLKAVVSHGEVWFGRVDPSLPKRELALPGSTQIPEIGLALKLRFSEEPPQRGDRWAETVDFDRLELPLYLRGWKDGDRFRPLNAGGTKKLQDFFTDLKIPRWKRRRIPIIVDSRGEIVCVVGLRIDDRVKVTALTKRKLRVEAVWSKEPFY